MNKQAFIKLATLRLAINYVLRNRSMNKVAKYKFQTDPNWEKDPKAVNEFMRLLDRGNCNARLYTSGKPADWEYSLRNKYQIPESPSSYFDTVIPDAHKVQLTDDEKSTLISYLKSCIDPRVNKPVYGPEQIKYILNNGLRTLDNVKSENFDLPYFINMKYDKDLWKGVNKIYSRYKNKYNPKLSDEDNAIINNYNKLILEERERKGEYIPQLSKGDIHDIRKSDFDNFFKYKRNPEENPNDYSKDKFSEIVEAYRKVKELYNKHFPNGSDFN